MGTPISTAGIDPRRRRVAQGAGPRRDRGAPRSRLAASAAASGHAAPADGRPQASRRNSDGVSPNARRKRAEKWLWLEKPSSSASRSGPRPVAARPGPGPAGAASGRRGGGRPPPSGRAASGSPGEAPTARAISASWIERPSSDARYVLVRSTSRWRAAGRRPAQALIGERHAQEPHHLLLGLERSRRPRGPGRGSEHERAAAPGRFAGSGAGRADAPARLPPRPPRDLVEQWLAGGDDQLPVATGKRAAHPERLASGDEQHLVRIAHHRVAAHLPDEEALIGQGELKLGREALRSHPARRPPRRGRPRPERWASRGVEPGAGSSAPRR